MSGICMHTKVMIYHTVEEAQRGIQQDWQAALTSICCASVLDAIFNFCFSGFFQQSASKQMLWKDCQCWDSDWNCAQCREILWAERWKNPSRWLFYKSWLYMSTPRTCPFFEGTDWMTMPSNVPQKDPRWRLTMIFWQEPAQKLGLHLMPSWPSTIGELQHSVVDLVPLCHCRVTCMRLERTEWQEKAGGSLLSTACSPSGNVTHSSY